MDRSTAKNFKYGALARRYASAVFDLASDEGRRDAVCGELERFAAALNAVPLLRRSLEDKEVAPAAKLKIIDGVSKSLSLSSITRNTVRLLTEKGRLEIFGPVFETCRKMVEDFERLTRVEVRVANPALAQTVKERIEKILSESLKKKVVCETAIDPSLIGGAVLKIGDISIDASISGRLERMKEELS